MHARSMTARTPQTRRRSRAQCALVMIAIAATAARIGEIPEHPLVFVRVLVSILAIGFLTLGPAASFGRRAIALVAIEGVFGIATFAFVDVAFVIDHQPQIGSIAAMLVEQLARIVNGVFR